MLSGRIWRSFGVFLFSDLRTQEDLVGYCELQESVATAGGASAVKPSRADWRQWASSLNLQSKNYIKRTKYKASRREFIIIKNLDSDKWNQSRAAFEKVNETKW